MPHQTMCLLAPTQKKFMRRKKMKRDWKHTRF